MAPIFRILAAAVSTATLAAAATVDVATTGVDGALCGTPGAPCASLVQAVARASPGDTIRLAAGTYSGAGNRNVEVNVSGVSIIGAGRDATVVDLERLGLGFSLGSGAGAAVVEKLSVINGNCAEAPAGREKNGAAFYLVSSMATIRDVAVRNADCQSVGVEYLQWSGAAFYLKDSAATIRDVEVTDSKASHGAVAATWGIDNSKFYNGVFERNTGLHWGGALLNEESSTTEFHACVFRYTFCSYGGVMDDGGTASPLFKGCVFEYNTGRYGAVGYHYADSRTRWVDSIFRHNSAVSAALYINANTKPTLYNCTFLNNSATEEAGAIRSGYGGGQGLLIFDRLTFIDNVAGSFAGAVALLNHPSAVQFKDCLFQGSRALAGQAAAVSIVVVERSQENTLPNGETFVRVRFVENTATLVGAAVMVQNDFPSQGVVFRDCIFEGNIAEDCGGAVCIAGTGDTSFISTQFLSNRARSLGGALAVRNDDSTAEGKVYLIDSTFRNNSAISGGGAFSCAQSPRASTHAIVTNTTFDENSALASGGAVQYKCSYLTVSGGRFAKNAARSGNGGAISLGAQAKCATGANKTRFQEVAFFDNVASVGGGLVFFDHVSPSCRLPILEDGTFNTSDPTWSWQDPNTLLRGNTASYGQLQATAPAKISTRCMDGSAMSTLAGCRTIQNGTRSLTVFESAFVGMDVELVSTMTDDFGQLIAGKNAGVGVQIEASLANASAPFETQGLHRFWFDAGRVAVAGLSIVGSALTSFSTQDLLLSVPEMLVEYSYLPPAEVKLVFGLCLAGWVLAGAVACSACPGGYFAPAGAAQCTLCAAGTYAARQGSAECLPCPAGHKCPEGTVEPIGCQQGQYQPDVNGSDCLRCDLGRYQGESRSTACIPCRDDRMTPGLGAVSEAECGCEAGYFSRTHSEVCEPCPAGMTCGFDADLSNFFASGSEYGGRLSTFPKLLPGFYSSADDPVHVFRCAASSACPGGSPGTCSQGEAGSAGFLCGNCGSEQYMEEGVCYDCQWHHIFVIALVAIAAVLCLMYLARASAMALTAQNPQMTTFVMILGQLLTFLQVSAAIGKLPINWTTPFLHFINVLTYLSLGLGALNLECLKMGSESQAFSFQVLMPLVLVAILMLIFGAEKAARPRRVVLSDFTNAIGQLALTFYITFTLTALVPLHCYSHPNGEASVVQYPQVRCNNDSDHATMVAVGIVGLLIYPAFTVCLVLFAVLQYPKKIVSSDLEFIQRFRFVFCRWSPERYWFGAILVLRNLLLPVFPMTIPEDAADVTAMTMLLWLMLVMLAIVMFMPWRQKELNYTDICMNFILTFTLAIGSMALTDSKTLSQSLNTFLFTIAVLVILFGLGIALHQLVKALRKEAQYAVFLSHHKGAGACAARLLKYMLQKELKTPIFYDCDDLASLSGIFTAVKQSRCLVVMMSGETLCRPWCAGEIVTAHHCKIRMLPMRLSEDDEVWSSLSTVEQDQFIQEQFQVLRPHGINLDHIQPAFDALLQQSTLELPLLQWTKSLSKAVKGIAGAAMTGEMPGSAGTMWMTRSGTSEAGTMWLSRSVTSERSGSSGQRSSSYIPALGRSLTDLTMNLNSSAARTASTLIVCDGRSPEAAAATHFIRQMLQERLQVQIDADLDLSLGEFAEVVRSDALLSVLFVASPASTMQSGSQLARLALLYKLRPMAQTSAVVIGDSFVFPDQEWFEALEAGTNKDISEELRLYLPPELTPLDVSAGVRRIFKGIAKFINVAYANSAVLDASLSTLSSCVKDSWVVTAAAQLENGYGSGLSAPLGGGGASAEVCDKELWTDGDFDGEADV